MLLRRQRDRRPRFLETGIDEHPAVIGAIPVPDDVAPLGRLLDAGPAERGRMTLLEMAGDLDVERRPRAIADGPPERGRVLGVDVLIDGDADLPHSLVERRGRA